MPSAQSQAIEELFEKLRNLIPLGGQDGELVRTLLEECGSLAAEPTDVMYEEISCPGTIRPALWCLPQEASPSRVILYMHGGGFSAGSPSSHRKLASHLAKKSKSRALIVDYRRAPEHQFPKQIEDMLAAYKWLMNNQSIPSKNIVFAGDSAGGNLTIAVSLAAKKQDLDMPAAIVAFSPFLDMRLSGDSLKRNADKDALTVPELLPAVVSTYVGSSSLDDPLVDLLNVDLTGLPPMFLTAGTAEVLQDDASRMVKKARAAGIEAKLELGEGMQHVWVFMAGNAPEADECLSRVASFIDSKF